MLPATAVTSRMYDLLIPLVIHLSAFRPPRESLPFVVFLGLLMDSLSGAPFGLYLTTYFWLFVAVRTISGYLWVANPLLLALVVAAAVAGENLLLMGVVVVTGGQWFPPAEAAAVVTAQLAWALVTGPAVLQLMRLVLRPAGRPVDGNGAGS